MRVHFEKSYLLTQLNVTIYQKTKIKNCFYGQIYLYIYLYISNIRIIVYIYIYDHFVYPKFGSTFGLPPNFTGTTNSLKVVHTL